MELLSFSNQSANSEFKPAIHVQTETRRKQARYDFLRVADWDFFTASTGNKSGYLENIAEGGCLFRAVEPIEHRRWIRMIVREPTENLLMVLVGRVVRREDKMEAWDDRAVTLYRYGVEFIQPLNPVLLKKIKAPQSACVVCGEPRASIPDLTDPDALYCMLCHLRRACHGLLAHDDADEA